MFLAPLDAEISIHQFIYTSGKGGDYRITAQSSSLDEKTIKKIAKYSLIRYYLPPNVKLIDALRCFPISDSVYAISYVTEAGVDEYNRPERLRAHVLFINYKLLRLIYDFRILNKHFLNEDIFGDLKALKFSSLEIFKKTIERLRILLNKLDSLFKIFTFEQLTHLLHALFHRIKTIIIPSKDLVINSLEEKNKLTSTDVFSAISLMLPISIRKRLYFSSFIIHGEMERLDLGFIYEGGLLPKKDALILNLKDGSIELTDTRLKVSPIFVELTSFILDNIKKRKYSEINSIISLIEGAYWIIEKYKKKGAKIVQDLVDKVYELAWRVD